MAPPAPALHQQEITPLKQACRFGQRAFDGPLSPNGEIA